MILVFISCILFCQSFKLCISFIHLLIEPMYLFSIFYITFVLVLDHSDFDTRFQMLVVYLEDEVTTIVGRKVKGKLPKSICYEASGDN